MVDRSFKICNNWNSFHNHIESIKSNLIKNTYPPFLIWKVIKKYLNYKFSSNQNKLKDTSYVHYFKLPYIVYLWHHIKNKLLKLRKEFYKEKFNIKLVLTSFKIKTYFSYKVPIPDHLKSFLVYEFTCASCSLAILGKHVLILKLGLRNISKRITSHIFSNIYTPPQHAFDSYNSLCFKKIDKANSKFDLKIKEAWHINWRKPNLNAQQNHSAVTISL